MFYYEILINNLENKIYSDHYDCFELLPLKRRLNNLNHKRRVLGNIF